MVSSHQISEVIADMEPLLEHCAGLDVHKKSVVACRITLRGQDNWQSETCTFGTTTRELLQLADWLQAVGVTHIAMESTGVYWKPVFNILEGQCQVLLVNAKHIKQVPGRKTDVKDAEWIAQLLQHGLLRASYVPEAPQRDLRDMVRYRTKLIQDRSSEINRVQKVLEDANIKLASVVSDIMELHHELCCRNCWQGMMIHNPWHNWHADECEVKSMTWNRH